MSNLDNGGYAFPIPNADFQTFAPSTIEEYKRVQSGMTLRDYFAAKVINGILSDPNAGLLEDDLNRYAVISYKAADAMLKARE
ncbi:hypothetical protein [Citrobacter sedlakii]|uniref:hypothetical protein n=1 Tax=Citrobacter sedlakii TaxID=67826 RepID=UPI001BA6C23D|nr:hypothetical protein [Citrobacter sedlakii]EKJ8216970.1 hypothetical protein [Citrobacter sedlakii]QUC32468.1 hypothetical protein JY391_16005 [Citrobacter sedlakii]